MEWKSSLATFNKLWDLDRTLPNRNLTSIIRNTHEHPKIANFRDPDLNSDINTRLLDISICLSYELLFLSLYTKLV